MFDCTIVESLFVPVEVGDASCRAAWAGRCGVLFPWSSLSLVSVLAITGAACTSLSMSTPHLLHEMP